MITDNFRMLNRTNNLPEFDTQTGSDVTKNEINFFRHKQTLKCTKSFPDTMVFRKH